MSNQTRNAVRYVQSNMPPGTTVRGISDGCLYVVGEKFRLSEFWVMRINPPEKGLVHAITLKARFEIAEVANA
jgi:hypothetical protein